MEALQAMTKFMQTVTSIAVHQATESPIFGEQIITVSIDDEAGGWFITLEQESECGVHQNIRLDPEEFQEVAKAVARLLKQERA